MTDITFFKTLGRPLLVDNGYIPRSMKDTVAMPPCETCLNKEKCRIHLLACKQYAIWIDSRVPTKYDSKIPNKSIYNRLFNVQEKNNDRRKSSR